MSALPAPGASFGHRLQQYFQLTKPRVNSLIVFCAIIGMFLAVPGLPPMYKVLAATVGIALIAGAAAAVNPGRGFQDRGEPQGPCRRCWAGPR